MHRETRRFLVLDVEAGQGFQHPHVPMGRSGVDDAAMECWYWPLVSILQLFGHVPTHKDG